MVDGHKEIVSCGHISRMSMTVYLVMTGGLLGRWWMDMNYNTNTWQDDWISFLTSPSVGLVPRALKTSPTWVT